MLSNVVNRTMLYQLQFAFKFTGGKYYLLDDIEVFLHSKILELHVCVFCIVRIKMKTNKYMSYL